MAPVSSKIFSLGAEAELLHDRFFGKSVVVKKRIPKPYRHPTLDNRIRRQRLRTEITLLAAAKDAGIRTPVVFDINLPQYCFAMEFIRGKTAKELLSKSNLRLCRLIGQTAGKLHNAGIIHGDLTTSNMIARGQQLVLLDFGLGFFSGKIESQAVDLLNLKKMFLATHAEVRNGWSEILREYQKTFPNAKAIEEKISEIEKRTRYS